VRSFSRARERTRSRYSLRAGFLSRSSGAGSVTIFLRSRSGEGSSERPLAGDELEEDDAERVEVRARVERLALRLLGRHVLDRPVSMPRSLSALSCAASANLAIPKSRTRANGLPARPLDDDVLRL